MKTVPSLLTAGEESTVPPRYQGRLKWENQPVTGMTQFVPDGTLAAQVLRDVVECDRWVAGHAYYGVCRCRMTPLLPTSQMDEPSTHTPNSGTRAGSSSFCQERP